MKKIILINLFSLFLLTGIGQVEKVVLIEEGTGTWCSWCPRGFHYGHELMVDHPGEVILIAVHSGDDMEMEDATYSSSLAIASYPSGHVDRSIMGSDPTEWNSDFDTQSALTPPANIAVTTSYNAETGALGITVSAEFFETVTGDYRLGAIVVEDGITGPAPAYDQSNSYSGGGAGPLGGWELLPNPVPASEMVYDHVARQLVSNFNGDPGSLPGTPTSGSTYDYEWSSTIPEFMNADYTYVVGVLIDASTGEVLNAGKSDYLTGNDNAIPFFYSSDMTSSVSGSPFNFDVKAHDPDDDFVTITATGLPAWLTATDDGEGITALEGYPTDPGTYTIELEVFDGEHTGYQTLTIEIIDAAEDWIQVGEPGFTAGSAYGSIIDFMDGTPVMMYSDDTDGLAWYEYSDESWSLIGTIPSADNFHWDFAVSPD